jgi:uncharacterized protein YqeY
MRETINAAMKQAMRDKEALRLSTLRLVMAAIKDRDIALRVDGVEHAIGDDEILAILGKMIKQRKDSAQAYENADRTELAEQELSEIKIIQEFLPKQLSDAEVEEAVKKAIADTGASSIRDMGKVMGALKSAYTGQMDFGKAGGAVKSLLG